MRWEDIEVTDQEKIVSAIKHIPTDEIAALPYFKNRGKNFISRGLANDKTGERERAFSDVIKEFHEDGNSLCLIVGEDEAELRGAFTLFQWLTTNVGSVVLDKALRSTGKKVVDA